MSNDSGSAQALAAIDDWIDRLKSIHELENVAPAALAGTILAAVTTTAAAGQSPEGVPWAPRKADGGRALANAPAALSTSVAGNVVFLHLDGIETLHQWGTSKIPARPTLPTGGVPVKLGNAIREGLMQMTEEWLTRPKAHRKTGTLMGNIKGSK